MANVRFIRRSDAVRKDGTAPVYATLVISGEKIRISTGVYVSLQDWDPDRQIVRGRTPEVNDKNLIIHNTLARINDVLVKFRLSGEKLTKASFLNKYGAPKSSPYFATYALERLNRLKTALEFGTYRHHKAAITKLMQYAPELKFEDITSDWLRVYAAYLSKDLGNAPGTVAKNLSIIRSHYMAGFRDGKTHHNPFEAFRMPRSEPLVTFLTEEELAAVSEAYKSGFLPAPEQEAVKIWLWMAFTGMHISDARELRIEQIFGGEIHYTRIKTKVKVSVPLSTPAEYFFKIFAGDRKKGVLIMMPTDQWFNRRIKMAMDLIGIKKNISAKSARHTFATIFYRRTKDIGTLSKLLGHTSVRHTMVYTHIIKDARIEGMSVFDSFM